MNLISNFKCYLIYVFIMATGLNLRAQEAKTVNDTLENLINTTLNSKATKLFIHYDKTIYLPNETIWFTAYLLNNEAHPNKADILSVALVKNNDHTIAIQKKFVIAEATSFGSILIPDTIAAGDYSIIAYTNHFVKIKPDELFTQRITIKRVGEPVAKVLPKRADTINIQPNPTKVTLKFYPEGGDLVANLPAFVGWESKDQSGTPIKLKAVLLKDGEFIDTIETSAFGMGKFFMKPKYGSRYEVKVVDNNYQGVKDLPAVTDKGVALTLPGALTNDTLFLKVAGTLSGKLHIVIHNTTKVFYALANVEMQNGKVFKIALDSLPRGLAAVTIFNENLQPRAERIFYAHYDDQPAVNIKTDAQKYGKRQKVTLKFSLNSNTATQALISVACVQANRIDRGNFNNIDNYGYLNNELNFLPAALNGSENLLKRKEYLENVLLIRGWRRYIDTTTLPNKLSDSTPLLTGTVTIGKKQPKKPMVLTLMGNSKVFFVNTDNSGKFNIPDENLTVPDGKTLALFATGGNTFITRISLTDPFVYINQFLADKLPAFDQQILPGEKFIDPEISIAQNQVLLKEVKVKARKDDQLYNVAVTPGFHTNACGDYVCKFNGLNCPYPGHTKFGTALPINGHRYWRHSLTTHDGWLDYNVPIVYAGCETKNLSLIRFNGVNLSKEFYAYNNTDINASDPLYNSTLYWKHQVSLTKGNPTELSFYTGDISGSFNIIIQGIADNGVVYNEGKFDVIK